MYAALYYPHSSIRDLEILKIGLLLWDAVEYIKPNWYVSAHGVRGQLSKNEEKLFEEAVELIGIGREPTSEEKEQAHSR